MDSLCSLLDNVSIDSILDLRQKIRQYDGAYRRGDDIIIVSDSIRTVRGLLKYTFLDGNPPGFSNFSLSNVEEDDHGKSYFMLDGNTPFPISILQAHYVQTLMEEEGKSIEFIPSLYYSYDRGDFFVLNVDGTQKYLFKIPFNVHFIDSIDSIDYVIHYIPLDSHDWCEPITLHQANVISRIFNITISELSSFIRT
jgi:hypothetical protein